MSRRIVLGIAVAIGLVSAYRQAQAQRRWDHVILSEMPLNGREQPSIRSDGEGIVFSGVSQKLLRFSTSSNNASPGLVPLDSHLLDRGSVGSMALGNDGSLWTRSPDRAVVFLSIWERSRYVLVDSFDMSDRFFAIADLAEWGRDGAILRALEHLSEGDDMARQQLVVLKRGVRPKVLLDLTPYVPRSETRIRVSFSTSGSRGERLIDQPLRSGAAVAIGAFDVFAIGDPILQRIQIGSIVSGRILRSIGDGGPGDLLSVVDSIRATKALQATAKSIGTLVDSLPWGVPSRWQAIDAIWIGSGKIYARRAGSQTEHQVIDVFLVDGRHVQTLLVPPAEQFRFWGYSAGESVVGALKGQDRSFRVVRLTSHVLDRPGR